MNQSAKYIGLKMSYTTDNHTLKGSAVYLMALLLLLAALIPDGELYAQETSPAAKQVRPNIVLILVDDMAPLSNDYTRTQTRVILDVFVSRTGGNLCGLNLELLSGPF